MRQVADTNTSAHIEAKLGTASCTAYAWAGAEQGPKVAIRSSVSLANSNSGKAGANFGYSVSC